IKERTGPTKKQAPPSRLDELQAKKDGADKEFASFGILIPKLEPADPKKIRPRKVVLQEHLWLRMRALMGSNWRADVASVMVLGLAKTSYQAEKVLGCSSETAYRNWNALKEAGAEHLLKKSA